MKYSMIAGVALISCWASAGTHLGKVQQIDLHSDAWSNYDPNDLGFLSLYIENLPNSCNESNGLGRVVITTDHPLFESVYSMALTAKATGSNLRIHYLETCNTRDRAWDFGYISYP